jgi:hypothetical protein
MDTVVRGATVVFAANFSDVNGEVASPLSADLHIAYRRNKQLQNAAIALARNGDTWSTAWDSAVADQCQVDWHVRSVGSDVAGLQGSFKLETNRANPNA